MSQHPHLQAKVTNAILPSNEIQNRVFYNTNRNDYFALFGCDDCINQVEKAQELVQKPLQSVFDEAFDYSDGYTIEITFSFAIPSGGLAHNSFHGACIEHQESGGSKSCFGIKWNKATATTTGWGKLRSYYFDSLTELGATSPDLTDSNYLDPRIDGFSNTWALGGAIGESNAWQFRCFRHLPKEDKPEDKRFKFGDHARVWIYDSSSVTQKWSQDNYIFFEMLGANMTLPSLSFVLISAVLLLKV